MLSQVLLIIGVGSFVAGAVLILADDSDEPEGGSRTDADPPWWPDFERAFRLYAVASRAPRHALGSLNRPT